jgi:hypothetical protein
MNMKVTERKVEDFILVLSAIILKSRRGSSEKKIHGIDITMKNR